MKINKNTMICLLPFLMGCSSGPGSEVKTWVEKIKKNPTAFVCPLPKWELNEGSEYKAAHLRNPFEPVVTGLLDKPLVEGDRPKALLEHYPLDSLKMVGTVLWDNQRAALIKDGAGCIHSVKVHDHIGQHLGTIVSISERTVEIVEWMREHEGAWKERKVPLNLM
jgi:type IV pilus assembly protein PilP